MGWFSKKQPKSADDALVEQTLAFAQEVAQEQPDDEQALLALIDGIKMMPAKSAPATDSVEAKSSEAVSSVEPVPSLLSTISLPPVSFAPVQMPASPTSPIMIAEVVEEPLYPPASNAVLPEVEKPAPLSADRVLPNPDFVVPVEPAPISAPSLIQAPAASAINPPATIKTPPASPLPPPVLRPANTEQSRRPEPRSIAPPAPRQSEMRREIAQRVQNFKAHQQRLNDEREARIKKIYADMHTRLEKSGAPKSPPIS